MFLWKAVVSNDKRGSGPQAAAKLLERSQPFLRFKKMQNQQAYCPVEWSFRGVVNIALGEGDLAKITVECFFRLHYHVG